MNIEVKTDVSGKWVARDDVDVIIKNTAQECISILNNPHTASNLDLAQSVTNEIVKQIKQRFEIT